jgi:hypothetical protein
VTFSGREHGKVNAEGEAALFVLAVAAGNADIEVDWVQLYKETSEVGN